MSKARMHQVTALLPENVLRYMTKAAALNRMSLSKYLGEAIVQVYKADRSRFEEIRREIGRNLRAKGIRTLRDIERMIDEGRD